MQWLLLGALAVAAAALGLVAGVASRGAAPTRPLSDAERRRLNQLLPRAREAILNLRSKMAGHGLDFRVGTTMRSASEQAAQVAEGRSAASVSWHMSGRAADLYMIDPRTGAADVKAANRPAYELLHRTAQALGFRVLGFRVLQTSGGATFTDPYHVEWREGLGGADGALARYQTGADRSADGQLYV